MSLSTTIESYNLLWLGWSILSFSVCISGLLVLYCPDLLPNFIHRAVKYGKSAEAHDKSSFLGLPKRYFFHFYLVALIFYIFLTLLAINIYFNVNLFGDPIQKSPSFLKILLDYFASYDHLGIKYQRVASGKFDSS